MNLWMHLSMCRLCSRFRKDVLYLHNQTQRLANEPSFGGTEAEVKLPPESRERMNRILSSEQ
jgi:hypothetical protein